jgi:uncharacterized protein (TIGR03435 family)
MDAGPTAVRTDPWGNQFRNIAALVNVTNAFASISMKSRSRPRGVLAMTRLLLGAGAVALFSMPVLAQAPPTRGAFDVASIQVSTRPNPGMRGGILRGDRYELRNATMVDLIRTAWNVPPERVSGGPSWLEWNRWDIAALAPEGTPPARLQDMLKTLLAERFKLVVREDTATVTNMALKVAGSHKLREASAPGGCQAQGAPDANGVPLQTVTCKGESIKDFVDLIARGMSAYFPNGQQVIDETGLSGLWDFEFKVHPRQALAQAGSDAIPLDKALAGIGLKLEPKEMTVPAIVVDSVTTEFTPNAPDLARRMPALPSPTFEVADVKSSAPGSDAPPRMQLMPTGQVNGSNAPINRIIQLAWNLPSEQYLVGPKWLETNKYEVIARVYANAGPNANVQQDEDIARRMLQALLVERFQMKYHMEDRPMTAFNIRADNPKMAKGDPTKRTRCFEGAPPGSAAAARPPQFGRQVTCQNISMAQFGTWLPSIAGGYTQVPAIDMTGLVGGYDFTLNFSPIGQVVGPRPDAAGAPNGAAVDPTGALSLLDAVRQQLGIRLEETKRPLPVMVIDSMNEKPTDN